MGWNSVKTSFAMVILMAGAAMGGDMLPLLNKTQRGDWGAVGAVNMAGFKVKVSCTGTLIAPDLVLTAAHCVGDPTSGKARHFVAGLTLDRYLAHAKSTQVMRHPAYDLVSGNRKFRYDIALIRLDHPIITDQLTPLPVSDGLRAQAGPFAIVGYSRFRPYLLSGRFDCNRTNPAQADTVILDCPVISGNSGAPVLVQTPQGWRVVAVVTATIGPSAKARSLAAAIPDWVLIEAAKSRARYKTTQGSATKQLRSVQN